MADGWQMDGNGNPSAPGPGVEAEFSTHMLAERCCWEPGRLTMAVECPGEVGVG